MNINTFVTADEILSEVLVTISDTELSSGVTKGWYFARIRDGLKKLGYESFFHEETMQIRNWVTDVEPKGERRLWMPENIFNIREMYLVGGDCCYYDPKVRIHWKFDYNNKDITPGKSTSFRNEHMDNDEIYGMDSGITTTSSITSSSITVAHIQNGMIMIENDGVAFPHLRIIYNGIPKGDIKTAKIIPDFFKEALHDYVAEKFLRSKMAKEARQYKVAYDATRLSLNGENPRVGGTWAEAIRRVKRMDTWQKKSLNNYLSRANE